MYTVRRVREWTFWAQGDMVMIFVYCWYWIILSWINAACQPQEVSFIAAVLKMAQIPSCGGEDNGTGVPVGWVGAGWEGSVVKLAVWCMPRRWRPSSIGTETKRWNVDCRDINGSTEQFIVWACRRYLPISVHMVRWSAVLCVAHNGVKVCYRWPLSILFDVFWRCLLPF